MEVSNIVCEIDEMETEISILDKTPRYDIIFKPPIYFLEEDNREGVSVPKNILTDSWIQLMSLRDEDLNNHSGLTIPQDYRIQMIRCLVELSKIDEIGITTLNKKNVTDLSEIVCEMDGIETVITIIDKKSKYDISFKPPIYFLEEEDNTGVYTPKNILSDSWIMLMSLTDDELKECGLTTLQKKLYRIQMIKCLIELWD